MKDLCFAVFACNKTKVDKIIKENFADLKMNFKNMVIDFLPINKRQKNALIILKTFYRRIKVQQ